MPGESETESEVLDMLARAIRETRDRLPLRPRPLDDVLMQLEDVEARLQRRETLDETYRRSLSFHVVATRELDDVSDEHLPYLDLLSELASHLEVQRRT